MRTLAQVVGAAVLTLVLLAFPAGAVQGGAFTTINPLVDGPGTCQDGNPGVNCNTYTSKRFVWLNGGPAAHELDDGQYFFTVLVPGAQRNPNDRVPVSTGDDNLSDDFDTFQNRTFTVTNGAVRAYAGTHDFAVTDDFESFLIRLFPYSDTTDPDGVYILAICSLGDGYPVSRRDCKYDAFTV